MKKKLSKTDEYLIDFLSSVQLKPSRINADPIFHYTSADALEKILTTDSVKLWASRIDCLNDKEELIHVEEVFRNVCYELLQSGKISDSFYGLIKNIKPKHKKLIMYNRHLPKEYEYENYDNILHAAYTNCTNYVCCFSEEENSLPMWNYYSKGAHYEGYNIGFLALNMKAYLRDRFASGTYNLLPVIYDDGEKKEYISELILKLYEMKRFRGANRFLIEEIEDRMDHYSCFFKNQCFSHEKEIRLVINIPNEILKDSVNTDSFEVIYRDKNGFIIPYIEMTLPKEVLASVMIGPLTGNMDTISKQETVIFEMLEKRGYVIPRDSICHSKIPIRY